MKENRKNTFTNYDCFYQLYYYYTLLKETKDRHRMILGMNFCANHIAVIIIIIIFSQISHFSCYLFANIKQHHYRRNFGKQIPAYIPKRFVLARFVKHFIFICRDTSLVCACLLVCLVCFHNNGWDLKNSVCVFVAQSVAVKTLILFLT